jgi:hypothetical protein
MKAIAMPKRSDAPPPDMAALRKANPDVPKHVPPLPTNAGVDE